MSDMPAHSCQQREKIATMENSIKTIFKRMDEQLEITKAVYELTTEIRVMNERIENLATAQKVIKTDLEELKATPKNRLNSIVTAIISAVVGGIITYAFFLLGFGG